MKPLRWVERPANVMRYRLGQLLLRGTAYRLLVMSALVTFVAVGGGLAAWKLDPGFGSAGEAVWWAFLRLSDPGYLGDDQGLVRRVISTVLTVLGYVIFLGALVAIMTQWLNASVRGLETGLTPIAARGHVLVAGWTDRTVSILREMFRTEERSRSLLGYESGRLLAVVLAEEASPELHATLRERMGDYWRDRQVILRQGEPLFLDHLERADYAHAATILLPGDPFAGDGEIDSDLRSVKAIASIGRQLRHLKGERPPLLVAELFDARRAPVARSFYDGPLELVESDRLIARLLGQNVRYPGLSQAYRELLFSRAGRRLRVLPVPAELLGNTFGSLQHVLRSAALLGLESEGEVTLLPEPDRVPRPGDRLVVFADSDTLTAEAVSGDEVTGGEQAFVPKARTLRRLLVLGWTRRVPALLSELERGGALQGEVHVVSTVPVQERLLDLQATRRRLPKVRHDLGDYTVPDVLAELELARCDAAVIVGSDRLESGAESDARTLAGFAALKLQRPEIDVLLELMDAENEPLLETTAAEHVVTPKVIGRILAQVALQPALRQTCDSLFGPGGVELVCASEAAYPGEGDLRGRILRAGHVPLGVAHPGEWGLRPLGTDAPLGASQVVCAARVPAAVPAR